MRHELTFADATIPLTDLQLSWNVVQNSESDYAMLTREFEDHVDDKLLEAVRNASSVDAVETVGSATTNDGTA